MKYEEVALAMCEWFQLEGLCVPNDEGRTGREFALCINLLSISEGKIVLLLAARKQGKSALFEVLQFIFTLAPKEGIDLKVRQLKTGKPDIHLRALHLPPGVLFHPQVGDPSTVPPAGSRFFVFCDDPMFPAGSSRPSGPQIIDLCRERGHTLLISPDPERLAITFRHFLKTGGGRVLSLHGGMKYFDGTSDEYLEKKEDLCKGLQDGTEEAVRLLDVLTAM